MDGRLQQEALARRVDPFGGGYGAERGRVGLGAAGDERVVTVTPFECHVAGVRLKLYRNPYSRQATLERKGPKVCGVKATAVEIVARRMEERLRRFLGDGWEVVRGEGW